MSLGRHIQDKHSKKTSVDSTCQLCCKKFATENSLHCHLNKLHGVTRKFNVAYNSDSKLLACKEPGKRVAEKKSCKYCGKVSPNVAKKAISWKCFPLHKSYFTTVQNGRDRAKKWRMWLELVYYSIQIGLNFSATGIPRDELSSAYPRRSRARNHRRQFRSDLPNLPFRLCHQEFIQQAPQ